MSRVLLPLKGGQPSGGAIDTAIAATRLLEGRIDAVRMDGAAEPEADGLQVTFRRACEQAGIALIEVADGAEAGRTPAASWVEADGSPREVVVDQGGTHDLMVSPGSAAGDEYRELIERALLRAQCPVLIAPTRLQKPLSERIMIAWDESPECWAAVEAAMPFLARAGAVEVVTIDEDPDRPRASQHKLLDHLRERGIGAEARVANPLGRRIGQALLSEAGDSGAGLMVMGAYSHSPLREYLFGGATREVLKNAAATPVLLAH